MSVVTGRRAARDKRHERIRLTLTGSGERPRLAVFRSNNHIYAQVIDDFAGKTLAAASTLSTSGDGDPKALAKTVGKQVAEAAKAAGITQVTFDRGGFMYHGRVQAVAEGAREGGLEF